MALVGEKMTEIKKYTKKDGSTAYKFRAYLGIDEKTGKEIKKFRSGLKTKALAKKTLAKLEFEFAEGTDKKVECNKTFQEVYEEWFEGYVNTVRESTWYKKKKIFENHILPAFGEYRIRTINSSMIQKELNKWFKITSHNFKPWYYYTSAIFNYAIMQGYIVDNPAKRVIMPKKTKYIDEVPNFWDKNQLETFFSYINQNTETEMYTLFRVLAFTGVRRGECLALEWKDVDMKKNTLKVRRTLTQGVKGKQIVQNTKTKKGNRVITLDDTTVNCLKRWQIVERTKMLSYGFNIKNDDQLIFPTRNNTHKSLNTPKKWMDKILERLKADDIKLPKLTIHGFRHTHASALFAAGATIKEVQERLGHEDAQTTLNIYTHVTQNQNIEVANKLVNYLNF